MSEIEEIPLVSICCITYNHAPYIRQCLDGFLMQKTDFPIEILVHDDASTDGTADIVREYEAKYPHLINPIYQTENQYSKGVNISATFNFPRAKGKYIAMCEGDDYWTDPLKLQKQVDFLESNPEYVMCSHRCASCYGTDPRIEQPAEVEECSYTLSNLINGEWLFQTLSIVFRYDKDLLPLLKKYPIILDSVLVYLLLKRGQGVCFSQVMGVYRKHSGGIYSMTSMSSKRKFDLDVRLGIYNVERTQEAAIYLINLYTKPVSRIWLLKNKKYLITTFKIIYNHFGISSLLSFIYKKIILGKYY